MQDKIVIGLLLVFGIPLALLFFCTFHFTSCFIKTLNT